MMKKNVKSALMVAVFLSALYCPASNAAEHFVVNSGENYTTDQSNYNGFSSDNGGAFYNAGTLSVLNGVNFSGNTASNNGGAIYNAASGVLNVGDNVTFTQNTANADYYGGSAIYNTAGQVTIGNNAIFSNNVINGVLNDATREGSVGAAISSWNGGTVSIGSGAQFLNNGLNSSGQVGSSNGGAIYYSGTGQTMSIGDNVKFDNNTSKYRAGALYNEGTQVTIGDNATFSNNSSNAAGAVYNYHFSSDPSNITIGKNATFENNTANTSYGGAVANFYGDLNVGEGAAFKGNTAATTGGAIINSSNGTGYIGTATIGKNSSFVQNKANEGGAIYNDTDSIVNIKGGTSFNGNTATAGGGAVYNSGILNLDTSDGNIVFSNNTAQNGSDLYLASGSQVNINGANNVTFSSAGKSISGSGAIVKDGAGVLNLETGDFSSGFDGTYTQNAGKLSVTNATMFKNTNIVGGSIDLNNGAKVSGANVNLADGTGINIKNGTVEFSNGTNLIGATANTYVNNNEGGTMKLSDVDFSGFKGTYNQSNGTFELNNAKMFGNTNITGGNVDMDSSDLTLASLGASQIDVVNGSTLTVTGNSTISDNLTINNGSMTSGALEVGGDAILANADLHVTTGLAKFGNYFVNKPAVNMLSFTSPTTTTTGTYDADFEANELDITDHNMQVTGTTTVHNDASLNNSVMHSTDKVSIGNNLTSQGSEITVDANGMQVDGYSTVSNSKITTIGGLKFGKKAVVSGSEVTSNGDMQIAANETSEVKDSSTVNVTGSLSGGGLNVTNSTVGVTGTGTLTDLSISGASASAAFGDNLAVSNNLSVANGALNVNNSKDLTVTGNTSISANGKVTAGGTAALNNGLQMSGASSKLEAGTISVSGANADGNALTTTGGAINASTGTLTVNGKTNIANTTVSSNGNMTFNGTLNSNGDTISTTAGDVIVNSKADLNSSTITSGGNVEFKEDVIAKGTASKRTKIQSGTGKNVSAIDVNLTNTDVISGKDININTIVGTSELNNSTMTANDNIHFTHALNAKAGSLLKTLTGGFSVADKTTLDKSTIDAAGNAAFNGGLVAGNGSNVTAGTGMTVGNAGAGDMTLANSNVTVKAGGLTVEGNSSVNNSKVNVTGLANLKNGLTIGGNNSEVKASNGITISGTNADGNGLTATGGKITTTGGDITVANNANIANTTVNSAGNASFGGNLNANGSSVTTGNDLTISGTTDLTNTSVNTAGSANFEGGLTANSTQNGKDITVGNGLIVGKNGIGDLELTGTDLTVNAGGVTVAGSSTLNDVIANVTGTGTFGNGLILNNGSSLTTSDKVTVTNGGLTINDSNLTVNGGGLDVTGNASITNGSSLTVTGDALFNNNLSVDGSSITTTTGSDITVIGETILNNSTSSFGGAIDFQGGLTTTGTSNVTLNTDLIADNLNFGAGSIVTVNDGKAVITNNSDLNNTNLTINNSAADKNNTFGGDVNLTEGSKLDVTDGNVAVGGNVNMISTNNGKNQLIVNGNASVTGDINANADSSEKKIDVSGELTVNNINITNGKLDAGSIVANGSTVLIDTIANTTGDATFTNGFDTTNSQTTIGGNFTAGNTSLNSSKLGVIGNLISNGQITLTGSELTVGKSDANSNAEFNDTISLNNSTVNIHGDASFNKADAAGQTDAPVSITNGSNVNVDGKADFKGSVTSANSNINIGKDMTVAGNNTMSDGQLTVGGNYNAAGNTALTNVIANITGNAVFENGLDVNGGQTAEGARYEFNVGNGMTVGSTTASANMNITNTALNVTNDLTVNGNSILANSIANVSGAVDVKGDLSLTDNSALIADGNITIGASGGNGLTINNAGIQSTGGNLTVDNTVAVNLTDAVVDVKGDISVGDLTVNAGNKQTSIQAGNNINAGSITSDNAQIIAGNDMTVTGNSVLNNTVASIGGNAVFNNLEANKGADEGARYQLSADGSLSAAVVDVTNVNLSAGNGFNASGASSITYSALNVTGDAQFGSTLNTKGTSIVTTAIDGVANGDLTVAGAAVLDTTSGTIAGDANFNGGLTANKGIDYVDATLRNALIVEGKTTTTDLDITNFGIKSNGLDVSGNALLANSALEITGNADFGGTLDTADSSIVVKSNEITKADDGNLTVADAANLVNTPVSVAGNASFNGGLTTSSTDGERRAFIVGKDFSSTTTNFGDTNIAIKGNFSSSDFAQFNNSNLALAGNGTFGNGLTAIGKSIDEKSRIIIDGTSDVTGDLNLNSAAYTVNGSSSVSGATNADNYSEIHVMGDGTFQDKLTVQNNSLIEIGNNIAFNNGFDLLNNSNAYIHGDPTLDGDIRVTNGSVLNFVNPTNGFNTATGGSLFMQNGTINEMNNVITNNTFNGDFIIGDNSTANFTVDIDPRNFRADAFTFNSINSESGADATVMISDFNFSSFPLDRHIKLPQMFFSSTEIPDNINFLANDKLVFSPIGWYGLFGSQGSGYTASLVKYNPQVFRGQVATRAQHANQWVIDDILLNHAMLQGNRYLSEEKNPNRYSAILPEFAPYQYDKRQGGLWFKSYGNFETLSMTQDLNVKNNAYGALVGADFPVYEMENGWSFLPTAYVSYNGAHQTYDYVGMYQNGGQAGFMGTFMKDKFIGSILANGGVYGNNMDVAGYTDDTFNWFAGTAAKAAYNYDLTENFTVQPTLMAMYNTFGEQNWYSQFGDMGMYSGFLYGLNVAPGLNLIYGKNDWSLYATFQYVFNPLDNMGGHVGRTVDLPRIGLRHTFFEYGLGFTKMWKDRLNSYGQITFRNGGRTGVSFQFGLNWLF